MIRLFARHIHFNDNPWAGAPAWAIELALIGLRILSNLEKDDMATKQTLDALVASTTANTNATAAAKDALDHFVTSQADLNQKLADAIANSDASDDPQVQAAISAVNANTAALAASTPQVATAITAGTPAAAAP